MVAGLQPVAATCQIEQAFVADLRRAQIDVGALSNFQPADKGTAKTVYQRANTKIGSQRQQQRHHGTAKSR